MIISELTGGVGNQMFQYAFGYATAKRVRTKFYFYTGWYETQQKRRVELDEFSISAKQMRQQEFLLVRQRFPQLRLIQEESGKTSFNPATANITNFTFLSGYWQTEKYFAGYEDAIKKEFTFASPPTELEIINYARLIESKPNSVALHVRLDDYITLDGFNKMVYGICDTDYYNKAIQHIIDKTGEPVNIFVFSDDIANVKNHISFKHEVTLVETSDHISPTESMRLMSLCDHNIIANSSFSWWGAWLNENPTKIIIAPEPWFNATDIMPEGAHADIVPESWVRIGKG